MPPEYLAANDGSEQAAGRGSGLKTSAISAESYSRVAKPSTNKTGRPRPAPFGSVNDLLAQQYEHMTPYMQMTFAPLERRLDTAIFRALFASSVRQARQFVLHGAVTVNGKKMLHPSYALNPGDMFQVDVEKVLYGTGVQNRAHEKNLVANGLAARTKREQKLQGEYLASSENVQTATESGADAEAKSENAAEGEEAADAEAEPEAAETDGSSGQANLEALSESERWALNSKSLRIMLKDVKKILKNNPKDLSGSDKRRLRLFRADAKRMLSHPDRGELTAQELLEDLQLHMKSHELLQDSFLKLSIAGKEEASEVTEAAEAAEQTSAGDGLNKEREISKALAGLTEQQQEKARRIIEATSLTRDEMRKLGRMLQQDEENPVDETKPYLTPWRPRPFMSAFAFIPRYLEVNPNICAAVYLRHPVARKGVAEVPTPFGYLTNQLTHNWYLERG